MAHKNKGKDAPFPVSSKQSGAKSNSTPLISRVDSADARVVAMNKVSILINASGTTTTNGWKNPRLIPVVYVQAPPDKIWDFSFVAEKPNVANDVMTKVSATYQWNNPPGDIVGVRVVAETNQLVANVKK